MCYIKNTFSIRSSFQLFRHSSFIAHHLHQFSRHKRGSPSRTLEWNEFFTFLTASFFEMLYTSKKEFLIKWTLQTEKERFINIRQTFWRVLLFSVLTVHLINPFRRLIFHATILRNCYPLLRVISIFDFGTRSQKLGNIIATIIAFT